MSVFRFLARKILQLTDEILQLIDEDDVDNHHENSVIRQLAKDQQTCFVVLEQNVD